MPPTKANAAVLRLRRKHQLSQADFWVPLGVTQSAGSRYESGREIPKPVALLLELAYGSNPLAALKKLRRNL